MEQDLRISLWQNYAGDIWSQVNFGVFSQILTQPSQKYWFWLFADTFSKMYFKRELSKSWRISLSGKISQQTSGDNRILVFSYRFQHNLVKKIGFVLFADTFWKTVFLAPVEQDLLEFTLCGKVLQERQGPK